MNDLEIRYRMRMNKARIITKYPNRRLYDTEESRYVTLPDIRRLVVEKVDFIVRDRKNDADITRSILLQVITEQEQQGDSVMTRDFLSQVIRSYDKVVPEFAADYLEESMKFFMAQQKSLRRQISRVAGLDPFSAVADIAQKNVARWKALQEEVMQRFLPAGGRDDAQPEGLAAEQPKA
jgi:polyhydroxyalkanoate synthesis repressor PhaR